MEMRWLGNTCGNTRALCGKGRTEIFTKSGEWKTTRTGFGPVTPELEPATILRYCFSAYSKGSLGVELRKPFPAITVENLL